MAPNRDETFTIGLPSVFHTAPPHPASNARITCSPELAGGADASQNGFGLLIPHISIERSAIALLEIPLGTTYRPNQPRIISRAASRPSATALTTSLPPLMQSPP